MKTTDINNCLAISPMTHPTSQNVLSTIKNKPKWWDPIQLKESWTAVKLSNSLPTLISIPTTVMWWWYFNLPRRRILVLDSMLIKWLIWKYKGIVSNMRKNWHNLQKTRKEIRKINQTAMYLGQAYSTRIVINVSRTKNQQNWQLK